MSRSPGFGYIYVVDKECNDRLVRIGALDEEYLQSQSYSKNNCRVRENNGFCESSWTAGESAASVLAKIADHDKSYANFVHDFAERNGMVLMKEDLW